MMKKFVWEPLRLLSIVVFFPVFLIMEGGTKLLYGILVLVSVFMIFYSTWGLWAAAASAAWHLLGRAI